VAGRSRGGRAEDSHSMAASQKRACHPAQATSIGVIKLTANQHGPCGSGALRSPTWTGPRTSAGRWGGRWMSPYRLAVPGHHRHRDHSGAPGSARGLRIVAPGPVSAPATSCLGAGLAAPGGGQRDGLLERVPAAQAGPTGLAIRRCLPLSSARGAPAWVPAVLARTREPGVRHAPSRNPGQIAGSPMPGSDRGLARQILEGGSMRWTGRA
jgi:hypothetical protein